MRTDRTSKGRRTRATPPARGEPGRAVPLHFQVFTQLRDAIFRGDYPELTKLPGELAIGAEFNVSRITVRRALDELAARGLIEREQGRGTTVCPRPSFSPVVADVNGLLETNVLVGLETTSEILEFGYVPAPADIAKALRIGRGESVQMAIRMRSQQDTPFAHVTSWIPAAIGKRFNARDLARTPVLALLEQHGVVIDYVEQTISAKLATRAVARALGLAPGSPLLRVERRVYALDGMAVEQSRALYPAERHQYRITLRRRPHTREAAE